MSAENNHEVHTALLVATQSAGPLRERVREIVLQAVLKREADPQALRQIMKEAMAGVGDGLARRGGQVGEALNEAMQGLDEALGKSVYALQMALEEAWGRGRHFAESDLKSAAEAVRHLEDDLLKTLRETAERAQGGMKEEFSALLGHLRSNGTDTGARVRDVLELLRSRIGSAASGAGEEARQTARLAAGRLAEVTSGILRGLADALDKKAGG